ncbi:hypothetical protein B296_00014016 [Ensete ventricosum]|uniref:Uncharacterized protein n=1 Tax=Ensete ventricosum TaxID=4639 RepID=A0A427AQY2_ENSVE|nr:hypothetical protein B296_00014016 [Ensete ventricosum]
MALHSWLFHMVLGTGVWFAVWVFDSPITAYTMELEAEVAKLKEQNQELQKKQAEMLEMQKNQALQMISQQNGPKKQCLRRTQTGPW